MTKDYLYIVKSNSVLLCENLDGTFDITDNYFNVITTIKVSRDIVQKYNEIFRSINIEEVNEIVRIRLSRKFNRKYLQYVLVSNEYNVDIDAIKSVVFKNSNSNDYTIENLEFTLFDNTIEKLYIPMSLLKHDDILSIKLKDRVNGYNTIFYNIGNAVLIVFRNNKTKRLIQTKVDHETYDKIKDFRLTPKLNNSGNFYIEILLSNSKTEKLHRFIIKPKAHTQVDHIDRDTLNNLKENLREVTAQENCMNRGVFSSNTSNKPGVSYNKNNHTWDAYIIFKGKKTSKTFSINKFGNKNAFKRACDYRDELEAIYNFKPHDV